MSAPSGRRSRDTAMAASRGRRWAERCGGRGRVETSTHSLKRGLGAEGLSFGKVMTGQHLPRKPGGVVGKRKRERERALAMGADAAYGRYVRFACPAYSHGWIFFGPFAVAT